MEKFTIELEEMACKWMEHIADVTGKSIEQAIESAVYKQIIAIEESVRSSFTDFGLEKE